MDRNELISMIKTSRVKIEALFGRIPEDKMNNPALPGNWSPKDLLAHLGWWELRATDIYGALSRSSTPRVVINADEVDQVNARVINEYHQRSLAEVRAFEYQAYRHLLAVAESAPEGDLFNPYRFAWTTGTPFVDWIMGNSKNHYEEHLPYLERFLSELTNLATPSATQGGKNLVIPKAGEFIHASGRDIDQALFDCIFGGLPVGEALNVLAHYQNPDGGFHGLEVDIKAPVSNPFATELALTAMRWLHAPSDHPVLLRTLGYLETTQLDDGTWRFTPEVYQHDLAPWFQGWKWPNLNPTCTITGILKHFRVGSDRLHKRTAALFAQLSSPNDLLGDEYYNIRPYAYYFLTDFDLPGGEFYRWGVTWWMVRAHQLNPKIDASHWIDFAPMPSSSIAERLPDEILREELNRLLSEQEADGGWPTAYDPAWKGWNTVANLVVLRSYGKI